MTKRELADIIQQQGIKTGIDRSRDNGNLMAFYFEPPLAMSISNGNCLCYYMSYLEAENFFDILMKGDYDYDGVEWHKIDCDVCVTRAYHRIYDRTDPSIIHVTFNMDKKEFEIHTNVPCERFSHEGYKGVVIDLNDITK